MRRLVPMGRLVLKLIIASRLKLKINMYLSTLSHYKTATILKKIIVLNQNVI